MRRYRVIAMQFDMTANVWFMGIGAEWGRTVVAFHNAFLRQARDAFIMGAYYRALTATCALGERILDHLVLLLRDDFQKTAEYKRVHGKSSLQDWNVAIDTLTTWGVPLPQAAENFRALRDVRHRTLHFNPETDHDARGQALEALTIFHEIVSTRFAIHVTGGSENASM